MLKSKLLPQEQKNVVMNLSQFRKLLVTLFPPRALETLLFIATPRVQTKSQRMVARSKLPLVAFPSRLPWTLSQDFINEIGTPLRRHFYDISRNMAPPPSFGLISRDDYFFIYLFNSLAGPGSYSPRRLRWNGITFGCVKEACVFVIKFHPDKL